MGFTACVGLGTGTGAGVVKPRNNPLSIKCSWNSDNQVSNMGKVCKFHLVIKEFVKFSKLG